MEAIDDIIAYLRNAEVARSFAAIDDANTMHHLLSAIADRIADAIKKRNCDRFQTWEDAASAWDEYSDAQYAARRKPIPVIPWLFAPVEGKAD